ncbi:O-acetylserine/cysteine efflux transporter [Altererythrobacter atlanticus]|uniref:Amino-acid metabolite efflux pump n=1 Tax=Croceibacterium atlanticum TaxID=1267766 RepID=A0A0F7KT18_9SPHN|nr:DMT family transporter [Croceibacterium atlanticum]AKH42306.1 putative amino-acid metabolite efflux pump [Croceibacterium atlanticum]MBB5731083.1 O-acetylserine/cysteine efflux transporter [Croceibacterium atlanticum]
MPLRSFLLLVLICLIWALNVVVSRLVVDEMQVPPLFYAAARSLVVLIALLPWLLPIPERLGRVLLVTFAVSGGSFSLLFIGLQDATPSASAIVSLSSAPLTVLFAIVILGERIGWRRAVGIGFTFVGVGVAIASPSGWSSSYGLLFVFASSVVGSLGSVFLKRVELSSLQLQAWAAFGSVLVLLPLSAIGESGQLAALSASGWKFAAALAFSGVVVSLGAHTLYFSLLKTYDANLIAPLTLMTPIMTIAAGALLTGDSVGFYLVLGAAIAAGGVLVILVRPSRKLFKPLLVRPRL